MTRRGLTSPWRRGLAAESEAAGPRNWRLDRIFDIEFAEPPAPRPEGFSLQDYADESFGIFHDDTEDVVLRILPAGAREALGWRFHARQSVEEQLDGSVLVRFRASGMLELAWHLFTWGDKVEVVVLEPYWIRDLDGHRPDPHAETHPLEEAHHLAVEVRDRSTGQGERFSRAVRHANHQLVIDEIELDGERVSAVRQQVRGQAAAGDGECHRPCMVDRRCLRERNFPDDLQPHVQRRVGLFPSLVRQSRPPGSGHPASVSCVARRNDLAPGESMLGSIRVRRFPVVRQRSHHRFHEISDIAFSGTATEAEQEQGFRENGPDAPGLARRRRRHDQRDTLRHRFRSGAQHLRQHRGFGQRGREPDPLEAGVRQGCDAGDSRQQRRRR